MKEVESEREELLRQVELSKDSIKAINKLSKDLKERDWMVDDLNEQL